ncbi:hypothetical protein EYF80_007626 [Liparis tanakae]|uniref:Uncharacterized protein n=1 Tax=Liparis tanakae TaxID=230148 RepID=A0A4Z2IVJ9_9TELE|nr:hypothetical protein EYF80_007626 [Liparis tanakae]
MPIVKFEVRGVEVRRKGQEILLEGLLHEALLLLRHPHHFLLRSFGCSSSGSSLQSISEMLHRGRLCQLLLLPQGQRHGQPAGFGLADVFRPLYPVGVGSMGGEESMACSAISCSSSSESSSSSSGSILLSCFITASSFTPALLDCGHPAELLSSDKFD